jgi:ribokinase
MSRSAPSKRSRVDVLGLGCVAVDELLFVPRYPGRDGRQPLHRRERQCGGMTATALVTAARLGARAAYAGRLGEDEDSKFVRETLAREGVDLSHVTASPRGRPVHSYVVVEEETQTRSILYDVTDAEGSHPSRPARQVIEQAGVLLVDRWGMDGMIRAAKIARRAGVPVVGDLENFSVPRFGELLALADHLVVPEAFVTAYCGTRSPARGARMLWREDRQVVIVTCGRHGCWALDATAARPVHYPAFEVPVVDTTGCGDVFHGAYAVALLAGCPLAERVRFAAGAAALKATRLGGQAGIPTRAALDRFLRRPFRG